MAGHTCNQSDLAFKTVVRVVEDQYREYLEGTGVIGHTCHQSDLALKTVVQAVQAVHAVHSQVFGAEARVLYPGDPHPGVGGQVV